MPDNTIDSEVQDLHKWLEQSFAGFMASDPRTHTRASTQMAADYAMKRIEAIIHSEIAQEANKAELYGRLHQTIELFQQGKLSAKDYSLLHEQLTERISTLTAEKGKA